MCRIFAMSGVKSSRAFHCIRTFQQIEDTNTNRHIFTMVFYHKFHCSIPNPVSVWNYNFKAQGSIKLHNYYNIHNVLQPCQSNCNVDANRRYLISLVNSKIAKLHQSFMT